MQNESLLSNHFQQCSFAKTVSANKAISSPINKMDWSTRDKLSGIQKYKSLLIGNYSCMHNKWKLLIKYITVNIHVNRLYRLLHVYTRIYAFLDKNFLLTFLQMRYRNSQSWCPWICLSQTSPVWHPSCWSADKLWLPLVYYRKKTMDLWIVITLLRQKAAKISSKTFFFCNLYVAARNPYFLQTRSSFI